MNFERIIIWSGHWLCKYRKLSFRISSFRPFSATIFGNRLKTIFEADAWALEDEMKKKSFFFPLRPISKSCKFIQVIISRAALAITISHPLPLLPDQSYQSGLFKKPNYSQLRFESQTLCVESTFSWGYHEKVESRWGQKTRSDETTKFRSKEQISSSANLKVDTWIFSLHLFRKKPGETFDQFHARLSLQNFENQTLFARVKA